MSQHEPGNLRMNLLVFVSRIRKWLDVGLVNNRHLNFGVKRSAKLSRIIADFKSN